ncbi:MAG: carboxymuconolactone decarboxylase family protein [Ignavibacteriales bacterium]
MNRNQINNEIKEMLGIVPSMFKNIPDSNIEQEWEVFKNIELDDGPIPQKYRELIGIAISGVTKCRYCAYFHTEAAKLFGATNEEIEAAVRYAKNSAGWSTYINGMQIPYDQFKNEIDQVCEHVRSHTPQQEML